MQYTPPVGAPAGAPYVNVDAPAGIEGSPVPAEAIEHPMRELDHLIAFAGLTPSPEDLEQVRKAITGLIADALANITRAFSPGFIHGFILANVSAAPSHHISISPGACRNLQDTRNIAMPAPLQKRLDQGWAPGFNAGGRFSGGAPLAGATYHVTLISNNTNPAVLDVGFSDDPQGSDVPTGWTRERRLGSVLTNETGILRRFAQLADEFVLLEQLRTYNGTPPTARTFVRAAVPTGFPVMARLAPIWRQLPANTQQYGWLQSPFSQDVVPSVNYYNLYSWVGIEAGQEIPDVQCPVTTVLTDSSGQVALRVSAARGTFDLWTQGWIDTRDRLSG